MQLINIIYHNLLIHKKFLKYYKFSILFFIIGIGNILWQTDFLKLRIGDLADGYFNNLILENFYQNLIGNLSDFKNANFFYPAKNNILLSDTHWFLGILYAIPRYFDLSYQLSYNIFCLIGFIFNYWISYYVFKKLGFSKNSSAIGAFIFVFNPIILQKTIHIQLNFKIFIPLAILYTKYYFEKKDFRYIAYIIACLSIQQLITPYNGFFLFIYISVIFLFFLSKFKISNWHEFIPQKYSFSISFPTIFISVSLLILFSIPYIETIKLYNIIYFKYYFPDFNLNFLFTLSNSHIWNFITNYFELKTLQDYNENQYFMGFGVIFLLLFGLFKKNYYKNLQEFDKIIIKSTLLILIIFLTSEFNLIITTLKLFPPFKYIRAHSRFFFVIFFGFVYLALLTLKYLENNNNNIKYKILYYFIIIIIIIENLFSFIHSSSYIQDNSIQEYRDIVKKYSNDEEKIILFTQSDEKNYITNQLNIMMAFLIDKKIKVINGYTGYMIFNPITAQNCKEALNILNLNEKEYNNLTKENFKYAHEKLLIFHDKELCKNSIYNNENFNNK